MNRIILSLFFLLAFSYSSAQTGSIISLKQDSIAMTYDLLLDLVTLESKQVSSNRYKMYPTDNLYNFLKLDTQTGIIEQVQWSLDDDKEFSTIINREDLSWSTLRNSFELYPTKNMYQFILLDKATGRVWHVQWGLSDKERWIKRIY